MARRLLLLVGALLAFGLCFGSGLVIGLVGGTRDTYHRRYLEEREILRPAIAADPAFSGVEIGERSDGGIYLIGSVASREDFDRLKNLVARAIGESRTETAMLAVEVK